MGRFKIYILLLILPLFAFTSAHKFYVSVTQVDYIKDEGELQITTRIFIDDLEKLLRERYDETITLADGKESEKVNDLIAKYLSQRITIVINGEQQVFNFLGKEYEDDIALCYMEISNIETIKSIEISNTVLFEIFNEQENIIKTKINSERNSFILVQENDKGLLNFN